jgi:monoamine oxidase
VFALHKELSIDMDNNVIDYAIVGAGVAGTYCAWRLKQAYPDKNIVLFEYSERIGGRLFTRQLPDIPHINAELGGMRFIPGEQPLITSLIKKLELETRKFPMGADDDPSGLGNYAYFRGKHLHVSELNDSKKVPFKLNWSVKNKNPDQIQTQVMKLLVPDWQERSFDDWFEVNVFGEPLWKFGFWNLLYRVLQPDAYAFLKCGSGYDTNVSNGNAVTLLPTGGDYSSTVQFLTLVDGMNALPTKLAHEFKRDGGKIAKNHRLASIYRQDNEYGKPYQLSFVLTHTNEKGKTKDCIPLEVENCLAEHVILAMPRRSLELIEWEYWQKDDFLSKHLESVLIQGAVKIFLAYDYAWWQELGLLAGRSITDLPIRQTYYFTFPNEISNHKALLMGSYSDLESLPFWKGLENGTPFKGALDCSASELMVHETHRQMVEMHGLKELPKPYAAAYKDWGEDPFGGAWHSWKGGFKYNEIMPKMRHPVASENVYICGEAYSSDQGWAEGALETAELLLKEDLKVPPHEDVSKNWQPDLLRRMRYPSWFSQG